MIIKISTYLVTSILSPPFQGGNKEHPGKELVVKSITKSQAGHYVCKVTYSTPDSYLIPKNARLILIDL